MLQIPDLSKKVRQVGIIQNYQKDGSRPRSSWRKNKGRKQKKLAYDALQPTAASNTTISEAQAAQIRAQVRQAINEGFAKAHSKIGEIPKSSMANPTPSVIDMVISSPPPQ